MVPDERVSEPRGSALNRAATERPLLLGAGMEKEALASLEGGPSLLVAQQRQRFFPVVLTDVRGERVVLKVDRFAGQQEIYVKPLPELLSGVKALAGLTVLGDGSPVFLLDLNHLV